MASWPSWLIHTRAYSLEDECMVLSRTILMGCTALINQVSDSWKLDKYECIILRQEEPPRLAYSAV